MRQKDSEVVIIGEPYLSENQQSDFYSTLLARIYELTRKEE